MHHGSFDMFAGRDDLLDAALTQEHLKTAKTKWDLDDLDRDLSLDDPSS